MSGITLYTVRLSDSNHPTDGYRQRNTKKIKNNNNNKLKYFAYSQNLNVLMSLMDTIIHLLKIRTRKSTLRSLNTNMCSLPTTMRNLNTNMCSPPTTMRSLNYYQLVSSQTQLNSN